jgi:hypothetical protein
MLNVIRLTVIRQTVIWLTVISLTAVGLAVISLTVIWITVSRLTAVRLIVRAPSQAKLKLVRNFHDEMLLKETSGRYIKQFTFVHWRDKLVCSSLNTLLL